MRLIDADEAIPTIEGLAEQVQTEGATLVKALIFAALKSRSVIPTVDAVPVVRCKDCNQWDEEGSYLGRGWCGYQMKSTGPRYFCADGEVEEGEEDDETGDH